MIRVTGCQPLLWLSTLFGVRRCCILSIIKLDTKRQEKHDDY